MHFLAAASVKSDQKLLLKPMALLLVYTKRGADKATQVSPSPHRQGCQEQYFFSSIPPNQATEEEIFSYNNDPRKKKKIYIMLLPAFLVSESAGTTESVGSCH